MGLFVPKNRPMYNESVMQVFHGMKNPPEPALTRLFLIALILLATVSVAAHARQVDTPEEYATELSAVLSSGDNTALTTFVLDNPELSRQAVDAYRAEAENTPADADSRVGGQRLRREHPVCRPRVDAESEPDKRNRGRQGGTTRRR